MNRVLAVLFLSFALAAPALAEPLALSAISRYFNGLDTAQGQFTQINADGSIATGQIYLRRPGRIRFEYDPPNDALVIAGGGRVAIFDAKSNQPPEQYPLNRTPLSLILARRVDLSRADMVVAHRSDGTRTAVVAQDPENPDHGTIELIFTGPPVELRQWVITGGDGSRTTVILGDMTFGVELSTFLFNIPLEINEREDRR